MTSRSQAQDFLAILRARHLPFRLEQSCKLGPDGIAPERWLASFERKALGTTQWASLASILALTEDLGFPERFAPWLRRYQAGAGAIHFGLEARPCGPIRKVYLEYVAEARHGLALAGGPGEPVLVHRAVKHDAASDTIVETHYRLMPGGDRSLDETLKTYAGGHADPLIVDGARRLLGRAQARMAPRDIVLLDVADIDSARRSFDLQIYDAGLSMSAIADEIATMGRHLGVGIDGPRALVEAHAAETLGHLAGGRDARGCDFVTLYFGARQA